MVDSIARVQNTDWQALILSALIPLTIAAGFVYVAGAPDWQPSETWILGVAFLLPLDFIRALVLSLLGDSYKTSQGRLQAVKSFLLSVAILLALGIFYAITQSGIRGTFGFLTDPVVLQLLGLPILVTVIDGVIGIWAFRGDPVYQADRLEAIAKDSIDWLTLTVGRVPFVIGAIYGLLVWVKSDGHRIASWVPDPSTDLLRTAGLLYGAWYFFGKAAITAHVYTAHFARTGRRLLSAGWIQWILGQSGKPGTVRREAARYQRREPVKTVLGFEDKVIQSLEERSETTDPRR